MLIGIEPYTDLHYASSIGEIGLGIATDFYLLKRMTGLKMNVNKVKGVFKKWLTFEDAHGSEKTVAEVEGLVQEYINKLTAE